MVFLIIFAFHYAHLQPSQKWFLHCSCDHTEAEATGVPVPAGDAGTMAPKRGQGAKFMVSAVISNWVSVGDLWCPKIVLCISYSIARMPLDHTVVLDLSFCFSYHFPFMSHLTKANYFLIFFFCFA